MTRPKHNPKPLGKFSGELLLVGAGKMGGAMLDGWLARGLPPGKVNVLELEPGRHLRGLAKRGLALNAARRAKASVIVLAVKPQNAPEVLPLAARATGKSTLVLSIMAGRTLAFLEKA